MDQELVVSIILNNPEAVERNMANEGLLDIKQERTEADLARVLEEVEATHPAPDNFLRRMLDVPLRWEMPYFKELQEYYAEAGREALFESTPSDSADFAFLQPLERKLSRPVMTVNNLTVTSKDILLLALAIAALVWAYCALKANKE